MRENMIICWCRFCEKHPLFGVRGPVVLPVRFDVPCFNPVEHERLNS